MVKQLYISIDRVLWDKPKVCLYIKFRIGIYNFSKEHFMLSFIKISALYESYLLAKFLCYFRDRGYSLESSRRCVYPVSKRWKYKNTSVRNTFVLKNCIRISINDMFLTELGCFIIKQT